MVRGVSGNVSGQSRRTSANFAKPRASPQALAKTGAVIGHCQQCVHPASGSVAVFLFLFSCLDFAGADAKLSRSKKRQEGCSGGKEGGRSVLVRVSSVEVLFLFFVERRSPSFCPFLVLGHVVVKLVIKSFGHPHAFLWLQLKAFCFDLVSPSLVSFIPRFSLKYQRSRLSSTPPPAPRPEISRSSQPSQLYIFFVAPLITCYPSPFVVDKQQFCINQATLHYHQFISQNRKHGYPQRPQPQGRRHLRR